MGTRKTLPLPARLEGTQRRFDRWRRTRKGRSHIPEPLWTAAVKAAGKYGLHRTAQALRLDYYALKKRVAKEAAALAGPPGAANASRGAAKGEAMAAFVELAPPASVCSRECILELEDAGGAKMRVHLKGVEAPDLTALSRSFWGVEACHGKLRRRGSLPRRT